MPDSPVQVGDLIGHYEITEEIGRGTLGIMYKAIDRNEQVPVALKIVRSQLSQDKQFIERFVKEAAVGADLDHPNIVDTHLVGQHKSIYFICSALADGEPLDDIMLRQQQLDSRFALEITLQVAEALAYTHNRGVMHRAIKPSNIFVDSERRVKITDFCLANALAANPGMAAVHSGTHTSRYLSPEECDGEQTDHRSDIYSLGVILYEMLAGVPAFDATEPTVLMYQITQRPFPDILQTNPEIHSNAVQMLNKMVAMNPNNRYMTAEGLVKDIGWVLKGSLIRRRSPEQGGDDDPAADLVVDDPLRSSSLALDDQFTTDNLDLDDPLRTAGLDLDDKLRTDILGSSATPRPASPEPAAKDRRYWWIAVIIGALGAAAMGAYSLLG